MRKAFRPGKLNGSACLLSAEKLLKDMSCDVVCHWNTANKDNEED